MPALFPVLPSTYYSGNYAGIKYSSLSIGSKGLTAKEIASLTFVTSYLTRCMRRADKSAQDCFDSYRRTGNVPFVLRGFNNCEFPPHSQTLETHTPRNEIMM